MATQKPISTISYNSEAFLKEKLDIWLSAHIIQAYQYIFHKGEDGDKDHIHLRIEPNKRVDPMDLLDQLREYQIGKEKPLGCRPFRPSIEEDWILYVVHDKTYLKLKYGGGEKGEKIPYKWQDIKVPENYDMEVGFIRAKAKLEHTSVNMASRMQNGESPLSLILQGENVHTVNAIFHALSLTDYERLQSKVLLLSERLDAFTQAVHAYGLTVFEDKDGKIILKKYQEGMNDDC
ncbi:hypothetical protein [Jeotgalibaca porci]|uniref:hypothetical protein n=1 Tax=Jeotgalibaca porci TaxID=1868793 RepID=UPI00359F7EB9